VVAPAATRLASVAAPDPLTSAVAAAQVAVAVAVAVALVVVLVVGIRQSRPMALRRPPRARRVAATTTALETPTATMALPWRRGHLRCLSLLLAFPHLSARRRCRRRRPPSCLVATRRLRRGQPSARASPMRRSLRAARLRRSITTLFDV